MEEILTKAAELLVSQGPMAVMLGAGNVVLWLAWKAEREKNAQLHQDSLDFMKKLLKIGNGGAE